MKENQKRLKHKTRCQTLPVSLFNVAPQWSSIFDVDALDLLSGNLLPDVWQGSAKLEKPRGSHKVSLKLQSMILNVGVAITRTRL